MARLCASLAQLRAEIDAAHPRRDRSSDGWLGDAAHKLRASDHNPDARGVVHAIDVDKDGVDIDALFRTVIRDTRTEYVIWADHIATRANGFRWAKYTGPNKHRTHMHISGRYGNYAGDGRGWGYSPGGGGGTPPVSGVSRPASGGGRKSVDQIAEEVLNGHWGNNPQRGQRLQQAGYSPSEVQAAVNRRIGGGNKPRPPAPVRPSIQALAQQVINGEWGKGPERKRRLTAAGYDTNAIQAEVNRRLR